MELHSEIKRMKELAALTDKLKQLKDEVKALEQKRLLLMNDYISQGLVHKAKYR